VPVAAQMVQRSDTGRKRRWGRAKLTRVIGVGFPGHPTAWGLAHLEIDTRTRPRHICPFAVITRGKPEGEVRDMVTIEVEDV